MPDFSQFHDFMEPVRTENLFPEDGYQDLQWGHFLYDSQQSLAAPSDAQVCIVGVRDQRGDGFPMETAAPDAIRRQLYSLYQWHSEITLADLGNVRTGATLADTHAALRAVVSELIKAGKTVIILGGSHDLTLAQYQAYAVHEQVIEATLIDALIDLHEEERLLSRHFLMEMLTHQPNFVKHYNHIGFQSYFVHPKMLETLDKLRFDCYRLGLVRENPEDMEPVIRQSHLLSVDMCALSAAAAPASRISPNGLAGDEACALMRYAGMSDRLSSVGLYGYRCETDRDDLSAIQAAQMIWYFLDGYAVRKREADLADRDSFLEFHVSFTDYQTSFLKSKRTGRWWMRLPDARYIPCAYQDYLTASNNEPPERWLRAQERL